MITKCDWLSFTVDIGTEDGRGVAETLQEINVALLALSPKLINHLGMDGDFIPSHGRKPYSLSMHWYTTFVTLFYHPALSHALIEVSGQGIEKLREKDFFNGVLSATLNRLTRLDLATDILTDTKPLDFAPMRDNGRFKSHSEFVSASGTTAYVGSRTSDRYARVYRYNPPHERSQFLRVEHVLKGINARLTAQSLLTDGVENTQSRVALSFGWSHPDWQSDGQNIRSIPSWKPERHAGKTEFWVEAQVRPALLKLYSGRPDDFRVWSESVMNDLLASSSLK